MKDNKKQQLTNEVDAPVAGERGAADARDIARIKLR